MVALLSPRRLRHRYFDSAIPYPSSAYNKSLEATNLLILGMVDGKKRGGRNGLMLSHSLQ